MGERWNERVAGTYYAGPPARALRVGDWLHPHREPGNPHDPNAISLTLDGEHVGYVARPTAATFAPTMDLGGDLFVKVVEILPRGTVIVEYSGRAADRAKEVERQQRRKVRP